VGYVYNVFQYIRIEHLLMLAEFNLNISIDSNPHRGRIMLMFRGYIYQYIRGYIFSGDALKPLWILGL
jgi:hypothetical protein